MFKFLNTVRNKSLSVIEVSFGHFILSVPIFVPLWAKKLLGDNEGSESLVGEVVAGLVDDYALVWLHFVFHDSLGTLQVEDETT